MTTMWPSAGIARLVRPFAPTCVLSAALFLGVGAALSAGPVTQTWLARYNRLADSNDVGVSVAVDASGDVVVTGITYPWASSDFSDFITIKYEGETGAELWRQIYDGPDNGRDEAKSVAIDSVGDVFVSGTSRSVGTSDDYTTLKYDGVTGEQQWVTHYNGPGNRSDSAYAAAIDAAGNVLVTGTSAGSGTSFDVATVKYDGATGAPLWVARYDEPGGSDEYGYALAVDGFGNVVVTGRVDHYYSSNTQDYLTLKYDGASGAQLWLALYDGPASQADVSHSVAVDGSGNVAVTGSSYGLGTERDFATVKYDGVTGGVLWEARYAGLTGSLPDWGEMVGVDGLGNVFVTGLSFGSGLTGTDYATIKYDGSTGVALWTARHNWPGNSSDHARVLAVDSVGNVVVTGGAAGAPGVPSNYGTLKYDGATGALLWSAQYNGPPSNGHDEALGLALDGTGGVFVTGNSPGSGTASDIATIKYTEPLPATNVTSSCQLTRGGLRKNLRTGRWAQVASVKNMSASSITGPLSLALDSLSANATLFNKTGDTVCTSPVGSPYRTNGIGSLAPGATTYFTLEFTNPTNAPITWTGRVLAGTGVR